MGTLMILIMGFIVITNNVSADPQGPDFSNHNRVPYFPIYPEQVNISTTITDIDGVASAQIIFCDDSLCYAPVIMTRIGTSDEWYGKIPVQGIWGNGTAVGYEIKASDSGGNQSITQKLYFFYVSALNLTTDLNYDNINVGESIIVNGSAIYNGNTSAPVSGANVTFKITGDNIADYYHYMTSDSNGNFSLGIPLNAGGGFLINITMTDRSLVAYSEHSVWVLDITHLSENLQMTTCYPDTSFYVNGTAKYNNGNPVVNSDVEVRINDTIMGTVKTNSFGNYSLLVTAPSDLGDYLVNVSITDGTLDHVNSTSLSVCAVPEPDLSVIAEDVNITSSYSPFIEGEEIDIKVILRNLGTEDVENVPIKIFNGHPDLENMIVQNNNLEIAAGSYATYTLTWTPQNGTFDLWIVLDHENTIDESYEDNNNCTVQIFVDHDLDADKIGDSVDDDDDGDGFNDDVDEFPLDPAEWVDTDGDGTGNNADPDDDNDGLLDGQELSKGTDPLDDDTDDDGVIDGSDYDPLDPLVKTRPDDPESLPWVFLIIIFIIVLATILFMLFYGKRNKEGPNN
jgi:hypothetical protein